MIAFVIILASILIGDVAWWVWADRRLRRMRHPQVWRPLLGLFTGLQLGYLLWFILFRTEARNAHSWMPIPALAAIYLWHLLILPPTLLLLLGAGLLKTGRTLWGNLAGNSTGRAPVANGPADSAGITRREALAASMIALPPLFTALAVGRAMSQIHQFRIREIDIPLAQLPRELDGMTIAHVSDVHVGRFTRARMLPAIVEASNKLKADLVLFTGDLIDLTLADLPAGLDMIRRLESRHGLFICEGNHDLIEDPVEFERRMLAAGAPLLLNDSRVVQIRGSPVQLLGMIWSRSDAGTVAALSRLLPQRRADAFQILLAHHPHAFDPAAAVGIPLTLSGHTHGGQIMLNERLGAGPVMFRYWSGLYRQKNSSLVVSNGVGNWLPLRMNAPAEIVHLTLRSTA